MSYGAQCPKPGGQWIDYLDGRLDSRERELLSRHAADCTPCREQFEELVRSRDALRGAAHSDWRRFAPGRKAVDRIWDALRFRIRRGAEPAVSAEQLRSIVESVCGPAAADEVLEAQRPAVVEVLCGERVARLVARATSLAGRAA